MRDISRPILPPGIFDCRNVDGYSAVVQLADDFNAPGGGGGGGGGGG